VNEGHMLGSRYQTIAALALLRRSGFPIFGDSRLQAAFEHGELVYVRNGPDFHLSANFKTHFFFRVVCGPSGKSLLVGFSCPCELGPIAAHDVHCDLIGGTKNSHIATLVERRSRFTALVKVRSKDTAAVVAALSRQIHRVGLFQEEADGHTGNLPMCAEY
jgi:hypothetical protein